jgi:hypothetical protein
MSKKSRSKRTVEQGADRLEAEDRASMSVQQNTERKQQEQENRSLGGV